MNTALTYFSRWRIEEYFRSKKQIFQFENFRLAKGICGILSYAKEGVRLWFRTKRPAYRQLCLKLTT